MSTSSSTPHRLKLGIFGANGRMGTRIRSLATGAELASKVEVLATPGRGDSLDSLWNTDVVIDFSLPEASRALAESALTQALGGRTLPAFVVGTTGFSQEGKAAWSELSKQTLVLLSANYSPGIQLLLEALDSIGSLYKGLGFSAQLLDIHHIHKKDAPSGTALLLADTLDSHPVVRLPIESRREGEVVGTHTLTLTGPGEKLVLTHEAENRDIFARGAILAALRVHEVSREGLLKPEGIYSLRDVLRAGSLCR